MKNNNSDAEEDVNAVKQVLKYNNEFLDFSSRANSHCR